jgi:hypothetical protein
VVHQIVSNCCLFFSHAGNFCSWANTTSCQNTLMYVIAILINQIRTRFKLLVL